MKKVSLIFLTVVAAVFIFDSCSKTSDPVPICTIGASCDDNNMNTTNDVFNADCQCIGTAISMVDWGSNIRTNVAGVVKDENGNALIDANVRVGNKSTSTDENGVFILNDVDVFENLGYVVAQLEGYFDGSRTFVPTEENSNFVVIRMLERKNVGTISTDVGGTVGSEGVEVIFEPNSFVRDGVNYSGNVNVELNYIDPESSNFIEEMPGSLLGVMGGESRSLASYGMVIVELKDDLGEEVQLAEGSEAEIRFPISSSMQSSAPAEIDLWYFEENDGYWINESKAVLTGTQYIGKVNHFTPWNVDVPVQTIRIEGLIVDESGNGMANIPVRVTAQTMGFVSGSYTDGNGFFHTRAERNSILEIDVFSRCEGFVGESIYNCQIGPFSQNTTLQPIEVGFPDLTTITGTIINCDNQPAQNAYVKADNQVYVLEDGTFNIRVCGSSTLLTPYTLADGQGQTKVVFLEGEPKDVGELKVCGGEVTGTVTDGDGNVYKTIQIVDQVWMAENLKYNTGTSWCAENDAENCDIYGRLYDWLTALDACPEGWHIPSDEEWIQLFDYLGGQEVAGGKMKEVGTEYWRTPNFGATNSSGFNGLPGGVYNPSGNLGEGILSFFGLTGYWWSTDTYSDEGARVWALDYRYEKVTYLGLLKKNALSCRCIKD